MLNGIEAIKDQMPGIGFLTHLTINQATDTQRVRITHLVGGNQVRADWSVRVKGFANLECGRAQLPVPDADVVATKISGNYLMGPFPRDVFATLTNDKTKLGFIIQLVRYHRQVDAA